MRSWPTVLFEYLLRNVKLSLCLTKHHAMKTYWESGDTAPRILDLDTRWRWVVGYTPSPLYFQEKSPWYPLDRRLGGSKSRSGCGGEERNTQLPPGVETWSPDRPVRSPALYRLSYHGLERLRKTSVSLACPRATNWTSDLSNMKQEWYRCNWDVT
jgi:hypothetical protein